MTYFSLYSALKVHHAVANGGRISFFFVAIFLVVSQNFVIIPLLLCFLSGSQQLRVCQDLSVPPGRISVNS